MKIDSDQRFCISLRSPEDKEVANFLVSKKLMKKIALILDDEGYNVDAIFINSDKLSIIKYLYGSDYQSNRLKLGNRYMDEI